MPANLMEQRVSPELPVALEIGQAQDMASGLTQSICRDHRVVGHDLGEHLQQIFERHHLGIVDPEIDQIT